MNKTTSTVVKRNLIFRVALVISLLASLIVPASAAAASNPGATPFQPVADGLGILDQAGVQAALLDRNLVRQL